MQSILIDKYDVGKYFYGICIYCGYKHSLVDSQKQKGTWSDEIKVFCEQISIFVILNWTYHKSWYVERIKSHGKNADHDSGYIPLKCLQIK